ncbi:MoaF C-terminal domain-containing protein [Nocardia sp. NPDC059239]|uniref:MoaF C-terminal domain-containing protein n=1 Tax=unclassified Nocardia TaxID=2637762 RepID=UPI0036A9EB81
MSLVNWESLDELPLLAVGISQQTQYRLPFTGELAGRTLTLVDGDGDGRAYYFEDAHTVRTDGIGAGSYDATVIRDGIYLVDMMWERSSHPDAVPGLPVNETWALDLTSGRVTATTSFVRERTDGQWWVRSVDRHMWLADGPRAGRHEPSSGLAGKRVIWQYSDTDRYDHVYLNAHNFAWQCVSGVEAGLTELDRTRTYEVADGLYFFGWSEHVQPVESMLFVDLRELRTSGRMFGWEARTGEILHHQFSARGALLNVTTYPEPFA